MGGSSSGGGNGMIHPTGGDDRDVSVPLKGGGGSAVVVGIDRAGSSLPPSPASALGVGDGAFGGGGGGSGGEGEPPPLLDPARVAAVSAKLTRHLLPVFLAMSAMCYLDRTNSAFAAPQMTRALGFSAETYGLGSGLFFVSYSAAMIPSQWALMRFGAPTWLSIIVSAWGVTAMAFAFMRTRAQFFALRLLLGLTESGAYPGMWFYLNQFYPPNAVTVPYSLLEAAVGVANVVGAPLAASLLMLDGVGGMRGFQWLFLLEGLPSVALGVAIGRVLPRSPQSARFLGAEDKALLLAAQGRQKADAQRAESLGFSGLLALALQNRRVWLVGLAALLKNAAMVGLLFWAPLLVDSLLKGGGNSSGFGGVEGGAAAAAGAAAVAAGGGAGGGGAQGGGSGGGGGHHRSLLQAATAAAAAAAAAAAHQGGPPRRSLLSGGGPLPPSSSSSDDRGVAAVLLTAIPFCTAAACAVALGHRSQRRREKIAHIALPYALAAVLFIAFPAVNGALGAAAGFLCLTAATAAVTAPNAILNALASAVSAGPASAMSLALYNALGNLGGLVGPYLIGRVVATTGLHSLALQLLGLHLAAASVLVWWMRRWGL